MRTLTLSLLAAAVLICLALAAPARAGTYPDYQCQSHDGTVHSISDDWHAFGGYLFNRCAGNGDFGLATFGGGVPYGDEMGMKISVPAENPNTTIRSVVANWDGGGSWSGNWAFARWWGTDKLLVQHQLDFAASDNVNAPVGTRDFIVDVYCSTNPSGPENCHPSDEIHALRIGLFAFTLSESADPTGHATGGTLLGGDAAHGTASLDYVVEDADSGIRRADVRLDGTTVASADFRGSCRYDNWNACPKRQAQAGVDVDTTKVGDGAHRLLLAVTDAAGNAATVDTGQSIVVANAPSGGPGGDGGGSAVAVLGEGGDRGAHNGQGGATAPPPTPELVNRRTALVVPYRRSAVTMSR